MMYGREKAASETDWKRKLGYTVLGELHIPGRLRIWHVIKELRRLGLWANRPLRVLDAGGGEGAFAYYAARRFPAWRIVIGDNAPDTLHRGHQMKKAFGLDNLEIREIDLLRYDETSAYDLVICSDVLEHIVDDQTVVTNLGRALKPGAPAVFTSPSTPQPRHLDIAVRHERKIGFTMADLGHVREGYSEADFRRIFERAGLVADNVRYTFGRFGLFMYDIFFVTGDSRPNPLLFAGLFPFYMALSALDVTVPTRHGAAILGVARRPQ